MQKSFYNSRISPWVLLPLRLFLGITFVYAGLQKFADPQFFHADKPGFIGKQLLAFANGSPIHGILLNIAVPHALLFGYLIAYGEIAIGLGVLVGLLLRPASFFGMLLSLLFFLSVTWRVYPYFYGADIVFVFCWLTLLLNGPLNTGMPTLDEFLVLNLLQHSSPQQQTGLAGVFHFLLGTPIQPSEGESVIAETQTLVAPETQQRSVQQRNSPQRSIQQRRQNAAQRARETRRSFLQGTFLGGGIVLGLGVVIYAYRSLFFATTDAPASTQSVSTPTADTTGPVVGGSTNTPTPTSATTTQASSSTAAIAQVKSVAANSSVNFTIPSTGDPGLLIHLNNGQFVAYDALCTHAGCQVGYDATQQLITCPCHGAEFDPAKAAAVVAGPAPTPLSSVAISVDGATGAITLK